MRWFWQKKPKREEIIGGAKEHLAQEGLTPLEIAKKEKLAKILTGDDQEAADALFLTNAVPEPVEEGWEDNLGVESLYLPFGVRKGWADEPLKATAPLVLPTSASFWKPAVPMMPASYKGDAEFDATFLYRRLPCDQLLYRRLEHKRTDGSEILEPSRCYLDYKHEGKHGLPDVEYIHPDEYPNRVGLPPKDELRELLREIRYLNERVKKVEAAYDIQGL